MNYNEFLLESQFKRLEILYINENFDSFMDSIANFLNREFSVNTSGVEGKIIKLFRKFKGKIKILSLIVTLLIGYMTISDITKLMNMSGFSETEQTEIVSVANIKDTVNKKIKPKIKNDNRKFLKLFANIESSNNWKAINKFGYIGSYQFGKQALIDLGLDDKIDVNKFRLNPAIFPQHAQDKAMIKLLFLNKKYLGDYIEIFEGKIIAGVKISKSGLLAGSHLVGASDVKKFLDSNGKYIPKDGNNVPVTEYIKKFGGYNLTF